MQSVKMRQWLPQESKIAEVAANGIEECTSLVRSLFDSQAMVELLHVLQSLVGNAEADEVHVHAIANPAKLLHLPVPEELTVVDG